MVIRTYTGTLLIAGGVLTGMRSHARGRTADKGTVTIPTSDHDRANDTYTAEGHVRIEQQDIQWKPTIMPNNRTGVAVAEQCISDKGDTVMADRWR
jgi:hypothetical protein